MTGAGRARLILLAVAVVAVIAVAAAASTLIGGPGRQVETGIVIAVEATSLSDVEGFSIRTADGRTVVFRITNLENAATFPPGHLSEHKVSLAPIRVTYIDEGSAHHALRIEDAP